MTRIAITLLFTLSIHNVFSQTSDESWILKADFSENNDYYGITAANGMIGLVSSPKPLILKDVILNGVYDQYGRGRVSNILKVFNHLNMRLFVDGKHIHADNIKNFNQALDMYKAVLITTFTIPGKAIVTHKVRSLRHLPFTSLIEINIEALDDIHVEVQNMHESPDHLREVHPYFNVIERPHLRVPLTTSVAFSPTKKHKIAASTAYIFKEEHGHEPTVQHVEWDAIMHYSFFKKEIKKGHNYPFGITGSIAATEHFDDPHNEAERLTLFAQTQGMNYLIDKHEEAWKKLWKSDIEIGKVEDQLAVRSAIYHLYAFVRSEFNYSLSPMGLSGLGYNGHVFWDTELWMFPALLALQPELAKSLIEYRIDRMGQAKLNARSHGYRGVMFPWESANSGSEQTPIWALTGPFQHHITGCVGWAAFKYYQVTQDVDWLEKKGYPLLKEIAEFWCSRVDRNGPGKYDIVNVIGANEYQENIDNNAFTNAIAKVVLGYAQKAAQLLDEKPNPDWAHVAANIPIVYFEDGVTRENSTYEGETIKQADVNLLAYPLGFYTDTEQIKRDLAYYQPRYDEYGPAMGFSILATLHIKYGDMKNVYSLFQQSFRPNEVPPFKLISETKGGTNPYFLTGAGGMLQTVLFGFGGLEITDKGIVRKNQKLPKEWPKLNIKLHYE